MTDHMKRVVIDQPTAIAAVFTAPEAALRALEQLHEAGYARAWLATTQPAAEGSSFPVLVKELGGGKFEQFVRLIAGPSNGSLHSALIDHGVADDVARRLDHEITQNATVVVSGSGDLNAAATLLTDAGGVVMRGADRGAIGTPRDLQPANMDFAGESTGADPAFEARFPNFSGIYVGGQPTLDDVHALKARGVTTIIDLRMPSETHGTNPSLATEAGLSYVNIPLTKDTFTPDKVEAACKAVQMHDEHVVIHCASGVRSGAMTTMVLAQREGWSAAEALRYAPQLGFDPAAHPELTAFITSYLSAR